MLAISRVAVKDANGEDMMVREDLAAPAQAPGDAWTPLGPFAVPWKAVRWYGDEVVRSILSWYWFALDQSRHPVVWVSQYQLYIDYMLCGEIGPTKIDEWKPGRLTPHLDLLAVSFQTRARWFSKILKESLRHAGHQALYAFCRPQSTALNLHTGSLALPWCPNRLLWVDEWIFRSCPSGVRRTSKAIEGLPCFAADDRFPKVVLSCA